MNIARDGNGTPQSATSQANSLSSANGGSATFNAATIAQLSVTLNMPAMTVDPDQDLTLAFVLQAVAGANHAGVEAVADASRTARLQLELPAGSSFTTDTDVALPWVMIAAVPEPETFVMMGRGLGWLATVVRRRKH